MHWDDPNRPERHVLPRSDGPRFYGPPDRGDIESDGYWIRSRRPRVAGYPDHMPPERAERIEAMVREFDQPIDDTY